MFKFNIVAKLTPNGVPGAVNMLGADGKNYTLYYRISVFGLGINWTPVKFLSNFPV
jgi:hypothetical protein